MKSLECVIQRVEQARGNLHFCDVVIKILADYRKKNHFRGPVDYVIGNKNTSLKLTYFSKNGTETIGPFHFPVREPRGHESSAGLRATKVKSATEFNS